MRSIRPSGSGYQPALLAVLLARARLLLAAAAAAAAGVCGLVLWKDLAARTRAGGRDAHRLDERSRRTGCKMLSDAKLRTWCAKT